MTTPTEQRLLADLEAAVTKLLAAETELAAERDRRKDASNCAHLEEMRADIAETVATAAEARASEAERHIKFCGTVLVERCDRADARIATLEAALRGLLDFCWPRPDEGFTAFVDRLAQDFYSETRIMAPGKSVPLPMEGTWTDEERRERYYSWVNERSAKLRDAAYAALSAAPSALLGDARPPAEVAAEILFDGKPRSAERAAKLIADARAASPALPEEGAGPDLTIRYAQQHQPWTVPYAKGVLSAQRADVPHILATHCVLHAAKSVGKLAAVFEEMDHPLNETGYGPSVPMDAGLATIKSMSADLLTAALRFANLYSFDLSDELERRVQEKNGVDLRAAPPLSLQVDGERKEGRDG